MMRVLKFLLLASLTTGCAFHSLATEWHERVGPDGQPVHYTTTTKVGLNFLIALPLLGDTGIDGMVDDMTDNVEELGGDHVRIVQGGSENYWYGFPPFTWIITPVVATIAAEYRPSAAALAEVEEARRLEAEEE